MIEAMEKLSTWHLLSRVMHSIREEPNNRIGGWRVSILKEVLYCILWLRAFQFDIVAALGEWNLMTIEYGRYSNAG